MQSFFPRSIKKDTARPLPLSNRAALFKDGASTRRSSFSVASHAVTALLFFSLGAFSNSTWNLAVSRSHCKCSTLEDASRQEGPNANPAPKFSDVILPIMREWGCGHDNMEVPRVLVPRLGGRTAERIPIGRKRVVVDVGLGEGAEETMYAVSQGFIVFSFDPDAENVKGLRERVGANSSLKNKFRFVILVPGRAPDLTKLPPPPETESSGFAYVFRAALGETLGVGDMTSAGNMGQVLTNSESGAVPVVPLDLVLPPWVESILLLKIDTQGFELQVLKGATRILSENKARYILFEFSPQLMIEGNLGNHTELLQFLPSMRHMCFDMMGQHLTLPRPTTPLPKYLEELLGWHHWGEGFDHPGNDNIGPWEDIMCANWVNMLSDKSPMTRSTQHLVPSPHRSRSKVKFSILGTEGRNFQQKKQMGVRARFMNSLPKVV